MYCLSSVRNGEVCTSGKSATQHDSSLADFAYLVVELGGMSTAPCHLSRLKLLDRLVLWTHRF